MCGCAVLFSVYWANFADRTIAWPVFWPTRRSALTETPSRELPLLAGVHPNGQPVIEHVIAEPQETQLFRLLRSPLFVSGVAAGDEIQILPRQPGQFRVLQRSGQLAVRVFCRDNIADVAEALTPRVELLGGRLDTETPRALVYSIHVAVGFSDIEALFNRCVGNSDTRRWQYGNVYDDSGEPLDWWQPMLSP